MNQLSGVAPEFIHMIAALARVELRDIEEHSGLAVGAAEGAEHHKEQGQH